MQRVIVSPAQIVDTTLTLTPDQQHYLTRVLRLQARDRFLALDGQGHLWLASLATDETQATLTPIAEPTTTTAATAKPHITLAACLPKQGFDDVVRQVTELGVDQIVPLLSERTLPRPSAHKLQRWRRIATEAGEQSERLTVPTILEPTAWLTWLTQPSQAHRYLCVARPPCQPLLSVCLSSRPSAVVIAVGPEGGWTEAEVTVAIANGYQLVTLGQQILRSVTAPIAALAILQAGIEFHQELCQL